MTNRVRPLLALAGFFGIVSCASPAPAPEPNAIPLALGALLDSSDRDSARFAELGLWQVAHQACRSGAGGERGQVARACLELLAHQPPLSTPAQETLVQVLAAVADDQAAIAQLAAHADEAALGEAVIRALERIEHPAAVDALVGIARDGSSPHRTRAVLALAQKRSPAVAAVLLDLAQQSDPEIARAARHGLARVGDAKALALLDRAAAGGDRQAIDDLFTFAEQRGRAGNVALARTIDRRYLDAPEPQVRAAAIRGLAALANDEVVRELTVKLADEAADVRAAAAAGLLACERKPVNDLLEGVRRSGPDAARALALRLLVLRRARPPLGLLREGASDAAPVVRLEALALLGSQDDPAVRPLLLAAAEQGSPAERDAALASDLAQADLALAKGDRAAALAILHEVLDRTPPDAVLKRVLRSVAALASTSSLPHLAPLDAREEVRDELVRARFAIAVAAAASEPEMAIATLQAIAAGPGARRDRERAVAKLTSLGVDTKDFGRRAGFLVDWRVMGPFAEATASDFEQQPFGDAAASAEASVPELSWQAQHTDDLDGVVDLAALFTTKEHACAYAHAEIDWPEDAAALLQVGSDDGVAVWLNGALVHANNAARGLTPDEDVVPVTLRQGKNQLLVKVNQGGGDWGFCVRVVKAK